MTANPPGRRTSLWLESEPVRELELPHSTRNASISRVDVAIVGAGIAGLTAASMLLDGGATVAVLDAGAVAAGVSGFTTAKVTAGHGLIYGPLVDEFGLEVAATHAAAQLEAMATVRDLVAEGVDCDLERVGHHVYAVDDDDRAIAREAEIARSFGLGASLEPEIPLPVTIACAVRYPDQLQFHPRRYLLAIARRIVERGGVIIENAPVQEVHEGSPSRVVAQGAAVEAHEVVVTTGHPIVHRGMLSARMSVRRSYVITARIPPAEIPNETFISTEDPTHSLRSARALGATYAVASGEGHETGRAGDTHDRYQRLESWLRDILPVGPTEHRWSVQDNHPADGLPLIGRLPGGEGRISAATGFSGWGMTNGTIAGRVLADLLLKRDDRWDIYDPARRPPRRSIGRLIGHNAAGARDMVRDRLRRRTRSVDELAPGAGAVVAGSGGPVAAFRDDDGSLHAVSATCTHMGCIVRWNGAERSWDCPCHGSRFDTRGRVLQAPASPPLADRTWALEHGHDG